MTILDRSHKEVSITVTFTFLAHLMISETFWKNTFSDQHLNMGADNFDKLHSPDIKALQMG